MNKKIAIIGSGFSALAAACYLAKQGNKVAVYEKNATAGGRARQLKREGFTFDMGPTWYWMPDVFERFFADFHKKPSDYYTIKKLNPAYQVYFGVNDTICIPDTMEAISAVFEKEEPGSGAKLRKFMATAGEHYHIAINEMVYKPGVSPWELVSVTTLKKIRYFFRSIKKEVRHTFKNQRLIQILEFPVLFLGAKPANTPAFYNFMNYADFGMGTWHPQGGMYSVIEAICNLATELGVSIYTQHNVEKILVENNRATALVVNGESLPADIILSGADYHHTESLLDEKYRSYPETYWESRTFAPSSLLFYVGFNKKVERVEHHTLFFDVDFEAHAQAIYDAPKWPQAPLFYASFPSITDATAAPNGYEAGIFLIPLAPGIEDTPAIRQQYFNIIIDRLEYLTRQHIKNTIIFNQSFCVNDFIADYNAYKGNAYGLANTLRQTAFLRPKLKSKKVKHLYFTGQLTVPGPGVPPALISGKLAAEMIQKHISSSPL